jgi:Tfp pilus assembly protein PilV
VARDTNHDSAILTHYIGPSRRRRGFTLLEVLMATGLLLGCVIVLAELAAIGREHANAAEDLSLAQRLCENRINEMLCGATAMEAVENEELDEEGGWTCSVTLDPAPNPDLVAVRVTVAREAAPSRRAREFSLVRWMSMPGYSPSDAPNAASSDAPPPGGMP